MPGFVGFVGGRTRSPGPGRRSGAAPADASPPAGSNPSDRELLLASLAGMRQLQCVVAEMARKDRDDSNAPTHPETVKPGVTSFPVLPEPQSDEGCLLYQDWLVVVGGLVCDVSDSAAEWWSRVLTAVDHAYKLWVSSSPIDRLRVEPVVSEDLLQGKWARVNLRVCSMLMAALPTPIRSDVIACKGNLSTPAILFRLHTTYQPGGGSEKAAILKNLREPVAASSPASAVKTLREWVRWYNRCLDCGMSPPDATVLCQSLSTITSLVLTSHEEVKFRTFMLRSMLKVDAQPTTSAVLEYHRHLLAEMETLSHTGLLQGHAGSQDVQSEQQSSQTSQSDQDEEEQGQVQLAASASAVPMRREKSRAVKSRFKR